MAVAPPGGAAHSDPAGRQHGWPVIAFPLQPPPCPRLVYVLHDASPIHAVVPTLTARAAQRHTKPCDMPLQAEGAQAAAHVARRRVIARQLFTVLMLSVLAMLLAVLPGGSPSRTDEGGRATSFSPRKGRRAMKHTRIAHTLYSAPQQPPQVRPVGRLHVRGHKAVGTGARTQRARQPCERRSPPHYPSWPTPAA